MLLAKAIEAFKNHMINIDRSEGTIKGYTIELNLLNRFLSKKYNGPVYLDEITTQDMEDYMRMLKEKGDAPASRSRSVYIMRAFFNFCFKEEYIPKNIGLKLEAIPVPQKERVFLTAEEMKVLISAVKPPIAKLILNTLFFTGMRISECLNLLVEDVNLKEGVITVRNTKNKRDRQIPIHKSLMPLLTDYFNNWRKGKSNPYFFNSNKNSRVSADYINRILREATQRLNWNKHITCHVIRHSFASHLVARNVNIVNIQKLLGHSDLSTTSVYTHTSMAELINAVNRI